MNELEAAIVEMTGGTLPPDMVIELAKHSKWVEIDGVRQVVTTVEGIQEMAKDLPPEVAALAEEMAQAIHNHFRKES